MTKCAECKTHIRRRTLRCRRCGRLFPAMSRRRLLWTTVALAIVVTVLLLALSIPSSAVLDHVVVEGGSG